MKRENIFMNIDILIKYVSNERIDYLRNLSSAIDVNVTSKYKYHQMYQINVDAIYNFILNLDDDKLYVLFPLISINGKIDNPYTTLSRQFMISRNSNHLLINNFLNEKLDFYYKEIGINSFDDDFYFLIFKYRSITIDHRTFETKLK